MTDLLLIANNVSSSLLIVSAWWLAHTYSSAGYPYGKAIAALWVAIGMSVLTTMAARNINFDPDPLIVMTKCLLVAVAFVSARRVAIRTRRIDELEHQTPHRPA